MASLVVMDSGRELLNTMENIFELVRTDRREVMVEEALMDVMEQTGTMEKTGEMG